MSSDCEIKVVIRRKCRDTIWSWLNRVGPKTIQEIASHYEQSIEKTVQEIIESVDFFGFVFNNVIVKQFKENSIDLNFMPDTIVFVGDYKDGGKE